MVLDTKGDRTLLDAVELAQDAVIQIAEPGTVGEHEEAVMESERLATHYFACTSPAYRGWRWSVSVARAPRQKYATVCETALVPGEDALLPPPWLPYTERIVPGDIGAGDVLPYREVDPHLEAGFEATGEEEVDQLALDELGLGRRRVLSAEGREAAAQRWYDGEHGPRAEVAEKAPDRCRHLRLLPADGRGAAPGVRGVRKRVVTVRRQGGQPRPRVRRPQRGRRHVGSPRSDPPADHRRVCRRVRRARLTAGSHLSTGHSSD